MSDEILREPGVERCEHVDVCEHACRMRCMSYRPMEWPRYKDGAPVNFDDTVTDTEGFEFKVKSFEFHPNGFTLHGEFDESHWYEDDDRFDYPAPKVLGADRVEIREGDTVYEVEGTGHAYKVVGIRVGDGEPLTPTVVTCDEGDGTSEHFLPSQLTHRAPVLAADGRPLRVGETVWDVLGRRQFRVLSIDDTDERGEYIIQTKGVDGLGLSGWSRPIDLTHDFPDSWEPEGFCAWEEERRR